MLQNTVEVAGTELTVRQVIKSQKTRSPFQAIGVLNPRSDATLLHQVELEESLRLLGSHVSIRGLQKHALLGARTDLRQDAMLHTFDWDNHRIKREESLVKADE